MKKEIQNNSWKKWRTKPKILKENSCSIRSLFTTEKKKAVHAQLARKRDTDVQGTNFFVLLRHIALV